jgi:hypothetical protein
MTLAIIAVVLTIVIFVIWIAAWRKAKQTGVIDVTWPIDEATPEAPAETAETPTEPVVEAEQEKATTIVEDDPKVVEPPSLVVTETNTVAVEPIADPWANCKTVECEPKPIAELEAKEAPKAKKERKPRKTPLERAEATIAKLEGQIGRRTVLLKQLKKPVTKDERLVKWKASLKELKAAYKALVKAAKKSSTK